MADVLEVNSLRSLSGYRLAWDALLPDTPRPTFLLTYDWLENYWRHFGSDKRLRVLVVRSGGDCIGIVPLCVQQRKHRLGAVRVLTYPLEDWGAFYGPIGRNQTACLSLAMRHVAETPRDWDQIDLPWVAVDSVDRGRTQRAMRQAGLAATCESYGTSSTIDMQAAGNWDDYLAGLPRKARHELRRTVRRVQEWGDVEFVRHRPAPRRDGDGVPRWDLYDACEQIAAASWQATSPNGNTLCHPEFASFYRDTYAAAVRLGMADLALLKLAGRPVAFWMGYQYDGHVIGLRMGYREDAPIGGAGTTLLARLIEHSFERGDSSLDLGPGGEKYKQRLRTHTETIYRLTHTPRTAWKPRLLHATQWLRRRVALA
jgi:CelD/BcsL family acetyltransferase involved in cellulose biosynthesis